MPLEARLRGSDFHGGAEVPQEAVSRGEARSPLGAEGAPTAGAPMAAGWGGDGPGERMRPEPVA